jgi:hypothetical protein
MMDWSRQRWVLIASVVLAAQVAAIFALHSKQPMLARLAGGELKKFPEAIQPSASPQIDALNDPMVFAAAHPRGFSGAAWLKAPEADYQISNSIPPARFLEFQRSPAATGDANSWERPRTALPLLQLSIAKPPAKSLLMVEGALAARTPAIMPELPIQHGTDLLSNTVVQVGVRVDGFPLSTRIILGSGSRGADLAALEIARKIRFGPLPVNVSRETADLQWGQLVFQWFTTEPPSTNAVTATGATAAANTANK